MKNIKITVLLLCGMVLLPGCSLPDGNRGLAELPPAASAYTQRFDSDSGEALIDYNGRTYSFFGTIRNKMSNTRHVNASAISKMMKIRICTRSAKIRWTTTS